MRTPGVRDALAHPVQFLLAVPELQRIHARICHWRRARIASSCRSRRCRSLAFPCLRAQLACQVFEHPRNIRSARDLLPVVSAEEAGIRLRCRGDLQYADKCPVRLHMLQIHLSLQCDVSLTPAPRRDKEARREQRQEVIDPLARVLDLPDECTPTLLRSQPVEDVVSLIAEPGGNRRANLPIFLC